MIPAVPFSYRAQTSKGAWVTGTIDAASADDARKRLSSLDLRVFELAPAEQRPRTQRLSGDDFIAFNQQLAQLTEAGMPIENGLRLIAHDMRNSRLRRAVEAVAADLEKGLSLQDAFVRHSKNFPKLYGRVIEAGVGSGNLSAVLLNLGRHLEMLRELRENLWRAAAYPIMVLVAFAAVMTFIGLFVVGPMQVVYQEFFSDLGSVSQLPLPTQVTFALAKAMPVIFLAGLVVMLLGGLIWRISAIRGRQQALLDRFILPLPLWGRILRENLAARWCDMVKLGVKSGLDLPRSVDLAAMAVGSPKLTRDSQLLLQAHNSGLPLSESKGLFHVLPHVVPASIDFARQHGDLPEMLSALAEMHRRRCEQYSGIAVAILSPFLLIVIAVMLGLVITGMFLPLVKLIQNISG